MIEIVCLDSGIVIKVLVIEDPIALSDAASELLLHILERGHIVMPAFAWAEVGSVLRKKVRQGLVDQHEAGSLWATFNQLPIEFLDTGELRLRAWEIAEQYGFPTLYDAAFLACAEIAGVDGSPVTFWTADMALVRSLGPQPPAYIRRLGIDPN